MMEVLLVPAGIIAIAFALVCIFDPTTAYSLFEADSRAWGTTNPIKSVNQLMWVGGVIFVLGGIAIMLGLGWMTPLFLL